MTEVGNAFLNSHPFVRQVVKDKIRGIIVGSALGDAVGLYTEFLSRQMCKDAYPDGRFNLTGLNMTRFCNDSHRNKFTEGSWTDDTDHSLLITLSYLHSDGQVLSSLDFARRLKVWIEQGLRCLDRLPLGLGRVIGSTVSRDKYLADPKAAAYQHWATGNFTSAPNGSLMRTHSLGIICLSKTLDETFEIATDFCLVTHADPRCVVACCIATALLRAILRGEFQEGEGEGGELGELVDDLVDVAVDFIDHKSGSMFSELSAPPPHEVNSQTTKEDLSEGVTTKTTITTTTTTPPSFDKEELYKHTKASSYDDLELDDLRKQGYVYKCLGAAVLCLRHGIRRLSSGPTMSTNKRLPLPASPPQKSSEVDYNPSPDANSGGEALLHRQEIFEDIISELVMRGGDADTNATVAGAFLGALLGFSSLPAHWYRGLKDVNWLINKTEGLIQTIGIDHGKGNNSNSSSSGSSSNVPRCPYIGSQDPDTAPDGGKGLLNREQLESREKAFMEMYLTKTMQGKNITQLQKQSSTGQGLIKKWKEVFG